MFLKVYVISILIELVELCRYLRRHHWSLVCSHFLSMYRYYCVTHSNYFAAKETVYSWRVMFAEKADPIWARL
jgi:hypothetical protein